MLAFHVLGRGYRSCIAYMMQLYGVSFSMQVLDILQVIEFHQKSIGAIRCSVATSYDNVRHHAMSVPLSTNQKFVVGRKNMWFPNWPIKNLLFSNWLIKNLLFFYWSNKTCGAGS